MYSTEKLLLTTFNEGREFSDRTLLLFTENIKSLVPCCESDPLTFQPVG
jgi:hypothetical protein